MSSSTFSLPTGQVGINIFHVNRLTGDFPLADQARCNSGWSANPLMLGGNFRPPPTVDAAGMPTEDFGLVFVDGVVFRRAMRLTIEGYADLSILSGVLGFVEGKSAYYDPATDTTSAILKPGSNTTKPTTVTVNCSNTRRTPGSPAKSGVRGFHLMQAIDQHATSLADAAFYPVGTLFNQTFIDRIASTFDFARFMEMMAVTNITTLTFDWSDRSKPSDFFQGNVEAKGFALEYILALANAAGVDAWLNIYDRATPEYIRKVALTCLYGSDGVEPYTSPQTNPVWPPLRADLKLYFENANETWNYGNFSVWDRHIETLKTKETTDPSYPAFYDNPNPSQWHQDRNSNDHIILQRVNVIESVVMSKILRSVFGDAAMGTRVRPLLACQGDTNSYLPATSSCDDLLEYLKVYYDNPDFVSDPHPPKYYFWGLATGAYRLFAITGNQLNTAITVQDALNRAPTGFTPDPAKTDFQNAVDAVYASGIAAPDYKRTKLVAQSYGLETIIYEGTVNHGDGSQTYLTDVAFCNAVNFDPRMKDANLAHIKQVLDSGVTGFCHFNTCTGNWRLWDLSSDPDSPRLQSYQAVAQKRGNAYTPQRVVEDISTASGVDIYFQTRALGVQNPLGLFNFPQAGNLRIDIQGSRLTAVDRPTVGLVCDGVVVATVKLPHPDVDRVTSGPVALAATIPAGVHSIALRALQPYTLAYQSAITRTWLAPGLLVDKSTDTDDFTTVPSGATLESEPGGKWTKISTGASLIRNSTRGMVRPDNLGAITKFLYTRSPALTSPDVIVEATFDLQPDSLEKWVQLANADGSVVMRGGIRGDEGYFTIDQTGQPQGILGIPGKLVGGGNGLVRVGLRWNGTIARVLFNGYEVQLVGGCPTAQPGIKPSIGFKASSSTNPAIRDFRASNQAPATTNPVTTNPIDTTGPGSGQALGAAWLLRLLHRAM